MKRLGNIFQDSWAIDIDESHADSAIVYYKIAINQAREEGAIESMKAPHEKALPILTEI